MANPKTYQFDLTNNRPDRVILNEESYPGLNQYWPDCTSTRLYNPVSGIRAVVIHATAGGSSSGALWGMKNGKSSFHWLIPDEDEAEHNQFVWKTVPEELAAWHVRNDKFHNDVWEGKKKVNHWSLGIELVNRQNASDTFSDWQTHQAAKIVRYCWMKYPNLKHVVSHAKLDPGRRTDPGELFDWQKLKNLVLNGTDDPIPALVANVRSMDEIGAESASLCCQG